MKSFCLKIAQWALIKTGCTALGDPITSFFAWAELRQTVQPKNLTSQIQMQKGGRTKPTRQGNLDKGLR